MWICSQYTFLQNCEVWRWSYGFIKWNITSIFYCQEIPSCYPTGHWCRLEIAWDPGQSPVEHLKWLWLCLMRFQFTTTYCYLRLKKCFIYIDVGSCPRLGGAIQGLIKRLLSKPCLLVHESILFFTALQCVPYVMGLEEYCLRKNRFSTSGDRFWYFFRHASCSFTKRTVIA